MTEFTTMEKLQMKVGPSGAVLKYGEKVLVTCETYYGFTAEVYEFVETPEETGLGYIECHALKVKGLLGGEVYIGEMDGFEIYIRLIRMHYSTNLDLWRLRNN